MDGGIRVAFYQYWYTCPGSHATRVYTCMYVYSVLAGVHVYSGFGDRYRYSVPVLQYCNNIYCGRESKTRYKCAYDPPAECLYVCLYTCAGLWTRVYVYSRTYSSTVHVNGHVYDPRYRKLAEISPMALFPSCITRPGSYLPSTHHTTGTRTTYMLLTKTSIYNRPAIDDGSKYVGSLPLATSIAATELRGTGDQRNAGKITANSFVSASVGTKHGGAQTWYGKLLRSHSCLKCSMFAFRSI